MNNLDKSLDNYSQAKSDFDKNNQDLKKNNAELQNLNQQANEVKPVLGALNKKLQFADRSLATGEITTDEFLATKEELCSQESRLNILNDAIKAQESARQIILDNRANSGGILKEHRRRVAVELSQKLFSEMGEQQLLKDLVDSFLGAQEHGRLMEKDGAEVIFRDLGKKVMETVFLDQKRDVIAIPSAYQAYERIDEMIADLK